MFLIRLTLLCSLIFNDSSFGTDKGLRHIEDDNWIGKTQYDSQGELPANISQNEYALKLNMLFEIMKRQELQSLRRKRNAETASSKKLYVFTPTEVKTVSDEVTEYLYNTTIPQAKSKLYTTTEVEDIEIRFQVIPKECLEPKTITFTVLETENQLDVDECLPRWESIAIPTLPISNQSTLTTVCKDCIAKGVKISQPYLNIIVNQIPRIRKKRALALRDDYLPPQWAKNAIEPEDWPYCYRRPLDVIFCEIRSSYSQIMNPRYVDIGTCSGKCVKNANITILHFHSILHYDMKFEGQTTTEPCCAPYTYTDLNYLKRGPKPGKLVWDVMKDAIVSECTCQG